MKNKFIKYAILGSLLVPYVAFAQKASAFEDIINRVLTTFNTIIIPLLFVLATVIFLWGVIQYVAKGSDAKAQQEARNLMLWGIIGLAVMLAVWGVVKILISYFGVGGIGVPVDIPKQ